MTFSTSPCPRCGRQIDSLARRCQYCETLLDRGWSVGLPQRVPHHHRRARFWQWLAKH